MTESMKLVNQDSFLTEALRLTLRPVLGDDGHSQPGVLQGSSGLLMCGMVEVYTIHLKQQAMRTELMRQLSLS